MIGLRIHIIAIFVFGFATFTYGVDPQFSQFYSNSLYLAPSFAGVTEQHRIGLNARQQWPHIATGYRTISFAYDRNFEQLNSGLGILFLNDFAGSGQLGSLNIGILYSYDFQISKLWHIRPGVHFLYTERQIRFDKLQFFDQISADDIAPTSGDTYPLNHVGDIDFSSSALAYSDRFWFGFTVDHLLRPNQSLYYFKNSDKNLAKLPIKYSFFGGSKVIIKQELLRPVPTSMQFAYLYRQQADFKQLDFGVYYYRQPLVFGFWYRGIPVFNKNKGNDSFVFMLGYKLKNINIGYSYDFTVSKLITSTGGAHEISVSYGFTSEVKNKRKKMVPCPDF